jgi:hypothetical protein
MQISTKSNITNWLPKYAAIFLENEIMLQESRNDNPTGTVDVDHSTGKRDQLDLPGLLVFQ